MCFSTAGNVVILLNLILSESSTALTVVKWNYLFFQFMLSFRGIVANKKTRDDHSWRVFINHIKG